MDRAREFNNSLERIKDKKIDKFISRICKENIKLLEKNLSISLLKNMEINIYDSDKMEIIKESFMNNINNLKKYYRKLDNLNKINEKLFDQN